MSPRLIFKLTLIVAGVVVATVVHALRQREAKKRMALMESGRFCLSCDSQDVVDASNGIRCQVCGHFTSNAILHARVSSADIAAVTDPGRPDSLL